MDRIFQYFIKLVHGDIEIVAVVAALFVAAYLIAKTYHEIKRDVYEVSEKKLDKFASSIKESLQSGNAADRFQAEYYFSLIFKAKIDYETIKKLMRFPAPYSTASDYVLSEKYVQLDSREVRFVLKSGDRQYKIKKFLVKAWSLFAILSFLAWFVLMPFGLIGYLKGLIKLEWVGVYFSYLIPLAFILYIAGESARKIYAAERLMNVSRK